MTEDREDGSGEATPAIEVEVPFPLRECFEHCEVVCVRECCGIDALSTDAELIAGWGRDAGVGTLAQALRQLGAVIGVVEDHSRKVSSRFLNHYTADDEAREELLAFLRKVQAALEGVSIGPQP